MMRVCSLVYDHGPSSSAQGGRGSGWLHHLLASTFWSPWSPLMTRFGRVVSLPVIISSGGRCTSFELRNDGLLQWECLLRSKVLLELKLSHRWCPNANLSRSFHVGVMPLLFIVLTDMHPEERREPPVQVGLEFQTSKPLRDSWTNCP